MTDVIAAPAEAPAKDEAAAAAPLAGDSEKPSAEPSASLSDLEKIKAAQAARRSRRSRPSAAPAADKPASAEAASNADGTVAASDESSPVSREEHDAQMAKMREEAATLRLEMGSLRRNHLHNLKKVTEERDMFASQLAHEQSAARRAPSGSDARKVADVEVQLRAARSRNADLEAENGVLRDEVKQLNFRVQASKTIDAATNGYEMIVDDLVTVKLKCAQLQEEKEDLLRINKELSTTAAMLTDANGELEKSRSQWVVQCADLEKKRADMEAKLKELQTNGTATSDAHQDTSYAGSDLQDIKLN